MNKEGDVLISFTLLCQLFNKNLVTRSMAHMDEDQDDLELDQHPAPVPEEEIPPPAPALAPQPAPAISKPTPVSSFVEQPSLRQQEVRRKEDSTIGKELLRPYF